MKDQDVLARDHLRLFLATHNWVLFCTFTSPSNRSPDVLFRRLAVINRIIRKSISSRTAFFASIEKTKRDINHLHALIALPPRVTQDLLSVPVRSYSLPSGWERRQRSSSFVDFILRLLGPAAPTSADMSADDIRATHLSSRVPLPDLVRIAYQSRYGNICDCQFVRNPEAVTNYALKYAMKNYIDWQICGFSHDP